MLGQWSLIRPFDLSLIRALRLVVVGPAARSAGGGSTGATPSCREGLGGWNPTDKR